MGFLTASAANLFLGGRDTLPPWLTIDAAVALLLFGTGLTWTATRVFNGRSAAIWVPLTGPILWLLACRVPAFYESPEARVIAGTAVAAIYYLAAAREIVRVKDGLLTRCRSVGRSRGAQRPRPASRSSGSHGRFVDVRFLRHQLVRPGGA